MCYPEKILGADRGVYRNIRGYDPVPSDIPAASDYAGIWTDPRLLGTDVSAAGWLLCCQHLSDPRLCRKI